MTSGAAAVPAGARPLGPLEEAREVARQLYVLGRGLWAGSTRRDPGRVASDYDGGQWKDVRDGRRWLTSATLADYLAPADATLQIAKIDGRLVRIASGDYYRFRVAKIQEVIGRRLGDHDTLCELGCGAGLNLFSLSLAKRWRRLCGFDISENAVAAAREVAAHFGVPGIEFGPIDLTRAEAPAWSAVTGHNVFTYYCLEQLKYATRAVIENLLRARPRRVLHLEPTTELLQPWRPKDLVNLLYIRKNDYQDNLLTTLRDLERQGRLRIIETGRPQYAPTVRHDPTLVCWEPTGG